MLKDYCIGDSVEYVSVEYAKSGRSTCRKCKEKIGQDELRVGILVDDDHFATGQGTQWFHQPCFHFKPRHGVLQPNQLNKKIFGFSDLNKKDQKDVLVYLKQQLAAIKEPKNKRKADSKSKSKPKKIEEKNAQEKKEQVKDKKESVKDKKESVNAKKKSMKDKKAAVNEAPKVRTTRATRSTSHAALKTTEPSPQPNIKQVKPKKAKSQSKKEAPKKFISPSQLKQYKDLIQEYTKMSINELKEILQKNNQAKTGTKGELVAKCADGKLFGRIPTCSKCGGGKLRFNREKGTYACPGYMEDTDFVHCSAAFQFDEVKRMEWNE